MQLTMSERVLRIDHIAKIVYASCVERNEMKDTGHTCFDKNEDLAVDIVTLLDSLHERIQYKLKLYLHNFQKESTPFNDVECKEREMLNTQ